MSVGSAIAATTKVVIVIEHQAARLALYVDIGACEAAFVVFAAVCLAVYAFDASLTRGAKGIALFVVMLVAIGLVLEHVELFITQAPRAYCALEALGMVYALSLIHI